MQQQFFLSDFEQEHFLSATINIDVLRSTGIIKDSFSIDQLTFLHYFNDHVYATGSLGGLRAARALGLGDLGLGAAGAALAVGAFAHTGLTCDS